jgi:hypothetical protein
VVQQARDKHQGDDAKEEQQRQQRVGGGLERWHVQAGEANESRHQGGQTKGGE